MKIRNNVLAFGALLAMVLLPISCAHLRPDEAYVRADRARFELLEPMLRALADEDPSNDPDLTGVNGRALLAMLDSWGLQLSQGEKATQ